MLTVFPLPTIGATTGGGTDDIGLYRAQDPVTGLYMVYNGWQPGSITPPPSGDHPHYDAVLAQMQASGDLLYANSFRTVPEIADTYRFGSPVLFTEVDPETNPACKWNGGSADCFTIWRQTAVEADAIGVDNRTTDNLPPLDQPTDENALWCSMYDPAKDGARVLYPNDVNLPYLDTGEDWPSPGISHLWDCYQWDFYIEKARFYIPQNPNVSTTYKYFKSRRKKGGENSGTIFNDERNFDMRVAWNNQTFELNPFWGYNELGVNFPTGPAYGDSAPGSSFFFDKDAHGDQWFRCTLNLSTTSIEFRVWSYATQQNIWLHTNSGAFVLYDDAGTPFSQIVHSEFHPQQTTKEEDSPLDPRSTYTWYRNFVHTKAPIPEVLA